MKKRLFSLFLVIIMGTLMLKSAPASRVQAATSQAPEPYSILLFIGDGMGAAHRTAGQWYSVGQSGQLVMDQLTVSGWSQTASADNSITDSAAAATAISTGVKTNNGMLAISPEGKSLVTILELAQARGMAVGLITTVQVSHATPAAFGAHVASRNSMTEIALQLFEHRPNVLLGGGEDEFLPTSAAGCYPEPGERSDGRNLITEAVDWGYTYVCDAAGFAAVDPATTTHLLGLFADEEMLRPYAPSLEALTEKAIAILSQDPDGFFLMVEGGQIDWAAHSNDAENVIADTLGFDNSVAVGKSFADTHANTLLIATADHETGGMSVDLTSSGAANEDGPFYMPDNTPFYINWSSTGHTGVDVPTTASGYASDQLEGTLPDTDIFEAMQTTLSANPPAPLEELLLPSFDYAGWYKTATGFAGDPAYFGAYSLLPVGDLLYAGFGTGRPADVDGSLLSVTDGTVITTVAPLSEQGFIDMLWQGENLYIPGVDPCCGDDWTLGNTYTYTPITNIIIKNRNLPNILHTWGLWHDGINTIYAAASACQESISPPNETNCEGYYLGKIFSSTDGGKNWLEIARGDTGVIGAYRTYDIIGLQGNLYVVWNDVYEDACGIAVSSDGGINWARIDALNQMINCRSRLITFDDKVVVLKIGEAGLYTLDTSGNINSYDFPSFRMNTLSYNGITQDASYLYLITEDGRVMRSSDLSHWNTLASTDKSLLTVTYWPNRNWLVIASRGNHPQESAKLWKIDLATAEALALPTAPHLRITEQDGGILLDWEDSTGEYHIYRRDDTAVPPLRPARIASTYHSSYWVENPCTTCIYTVRAEDVREVFSLPSRLMDGFEYYLPIIMR